MKLYTLDFETYYDSKLGFTLSKMTPLEYVFDPRFEIIGVSLKIDDALPEWFSGTEDETRDWLRSKGLEDNAVLAHNMSEFDAVVLMRLGLKPQRYFCTLQMARLLGHADVAGGSLAALARRFDLWDKGDEVVRADGKRRADFTADEMSAYASYCVNDTLLCYYIYQAMAPDVPAFEWQVMDLHTRLLTDAALRADVPRLRAYLDELTTSREDTLTRLGVDEADLMSNAKFADLLESVGVAPPQKVSARTGKLTWAFSKADPEFTALLEHEDNDVANLVAARLKVKSTIEATRTQRFIDTARILRDVIPMPLRYHGAQTGRSAGAGFKLNPQNLSARNREPVLKRCMLAPPGCDVLSADSSNIEPRVLAWVSGQLDLLEKFKLPKKTFDLYKDFAAGSIYGVALDDVTTRMRTVAKSAVIGAGFMMGAPKFKLYVKITSGIDLTDDESAAAIQAYRAANGAISAFWKTCKQVLYALVNGNQFSFGAIPGLYVDGVEKTVTLPSGRKLYYRGIQVLRDPDTGKESFVYERKQGRAMRKVFVHPGLLTENIVQAIARDIIMWQAVKVSRRYPVMGLVHDEIVALARCAERAEALDYIGQTMTSAPKWAAGLPLAYEAGAAPNYGDA